MEKIVYTDEDYGLWLLLTLVKDVIHRARREELRQVGLTINEAGVLFYVHALGRKATPAEISRRLCTRSYD